MAFLRFVVRLYFLVYPATQHEFTKQFSQAAKTLKHSSMKSTKEESIFSSIQCPILSGLRDLRDLRGDEINATLPDSPHGDLKSLGFGKEDWKKDKTGKVGSAEGSEPETFITQR